jgi:hypothetical protein
MRTFGKFGFIAAGALLLASCATAQWGGPYGNGPYGNGPYNNGPSNNGPYGNRYPGRGGYGQGNTAAIDRTMSDLSRAQSGPWANRSNEYDKARRDLERFRESWMRGKFDRGRLDSAIGHVQSAAGRTRDPRMREMLLRDANELRAFRSSGGGYAQRYPY